MKAWQLAGLGGPLHFTELPTPQPVPGSVVVRMQASVVMSYMQDYVDGKLPIYRAPKGPFIPGGNGVGVIHAVGGNVWHLKPGQRVLISSHFVAGENVRNPAQMLLGITGQGDIAAEMQRDWPNGTLAEYAVVPASVVTPADRLDAYDASQLAVTMRYLVPYGGMLRGGLAAGETLVVSGATGAYGSAAVLVALAMGAGHVVALGRDADRLAHLATVAGRRVTTLKTSGDAAEDSARIRKLTHGGADMAFDMVGGAKDPNMTLAALHSLVDNGRLVLMGSMAVPLPLPYLEVMLHGWKILGSFMYPRGANRSLLDLVRGGLLDPAAIASKVFPLSHLTEAMTAASAASGLQCVVIDHVSDGS